MTFEKMTPLKCRQDKACRRRQARYYAVLRGTDFYLPEKNQKNTHEAGKFSWVFSWVLISLEL